MNCPICEKPLATERDEIDYCPRADELCWKGDCRIFATQKAMALAGEVMEAYADSIDLHAWHVLCEYIYHNKYPHTFFGKPTFFEDTSEPTAEGLKLLASLTSEEKRRAVDAFARACGGIIKFEEDS